MLTVLSRVEQINEESGTSYEILINDSIEKSREKKSPRKNGVQKAERGQSSGTSS